MEVISEAVFTANHLTDTDKQNSTGKYKQTQYKSEKVYNLKYSKTKLPWFSCLLQHSARIGGGLILQRPEPIWVGRMLSQSYFLNLHYVSHKVHTFGFDVHTPILIIFWQKKRSKQSYWKINYPSISYFVTSTAKIIKNGSCVSKL